MSVTFINQSVHNFLFTFFVVLKRRKPMLKKISFFHIFTLTNCNNTRTVWFKLLCLVFFPRRLPCLASSDSHACEPLRASCDRAKQKTGKVVECTKTPAWEIPQVNCFICNRWFRHYRAGRDSLVYKQGRERGAGLHTWRHAVELKGADASESTRSFSLFSFPKNSQLLSRFFFFFYFYGLNSSNCTFVSCFHLLIYKFPNMFFFFNLKYTFVGVSSHFDDGDGLLQRQWAQQHARKHHSWAVTVVAPWAVKDTDLPLVLRPSSSSAQSSSKPATATDTLWCH